MVHRDRPKAAPRCPRGEKANTRRRARENCGLQVARERFKDGGSRKTTGKFSMHKIAPAWKWLLIVLLAVIAIAASFHFDAAVRHWMLEHSNRTAKQVMRNVSRFGDWPEHVAAGLLVVAIAAWRGHKRWVHIGLTMIVACALAGIAARGVKIAAGRARPSVKQELGWHGPRLSSKYNSFPSGHTAATTAFFRRALFRQSARRPRAAADPAPHRGLTHVRRRALPFGRRLRCDPWNSVRVVLRARIPPAVKRRRRQPPYLNSRDRLRAGAELLFSA